MTAHAIDRAMLRWREPNPARARVAITDVLIYGLPTRRGLVTEYRLRGRCVRVRGRVALTVMYCDSGARKPRR